MARMTDYRVVFDAELTFVNGGGLLANDFRLDVSSPEVTEADVGNLFVRHLGLLMVDEVRVTDMRLIEEQHKGSRYPVDEVSQYQGAGKQTQSTPTRLVELSHPISAGVITYPGLPGPEITPYLTREASRERYAEGTEFAIDWIKMLGNTGTYLDSPFHRYADGTDLAGLPLEVVADLPVIVARLVDAGREIRREALVVYDVAGAAVLLHTGWDQHWGTKAYGKDAPFLTEAAAQFLADAGARLVGIDSVNIDASEGGERPAHSILLGGGIPVLEHLTGLGEVPVTGARLHAAPPRVKALGTFPVRAYVLVPSEV
jgi:arylformamidase